VAPRLITTFRLQLPPSCSEAQCSDMQCSGGELPPNIAATAVGRSSPSLLSSSSSSCVRSFVRPFVRCCATPNEATNERTNERADGHSAAVIHCPPPSAPLKKSTRRRLTRMRRNSGNQSSQQCTSAARHLGVHLNTLRSVSRHLHCWRGGAARRRSHLASHRRTVAAAVGCLCLCVAATTKISVGEQSFRVDFADHMSPSPSLPRAAAATTKNVN